jgi:hypothetical protein
MRNLKLERIGAPLLQESGRFVLDHAEWLGLLLEYETTLRCAFAGFGLRRRRKSMNRFAKRNESIRIEAVKPLILFVAANHAFREIV